MHSAPCSNLLLYVRRLIHTRHRPASAIVSARVQNDMQRAYYTLTTEVMHRCVSKALGEVVHRTILLVSLLLN